jgi:flagellar protein FliS
MSAATNLAARYKAVQVTTCSPGQLLLMLYDGAFRFLAEARRALDDGDRAVFGERVGRVQAILEQLAASLDRAAAPELCERLESLYAFCCAKLTEASVRRDADALDAVARVLEPLREAWRVAVAAAPR